MANNVESDITCYRNVRPTHRWDGRRNKQALTGGDVPATVIPRFHAKYFKTSTCWLWTAGKFANGYGMVSLGRRSGRQINTQAHRVAYVLANGSIPQGQVVMHTCDVRGCVNPAHLILGDQAENVRDAAAKGHYSVPHRSGSRALKIPASDVALIVASPESCVSLADRYGVTKTCISLIRRGLRRKAA